MVYKSSFCSRDLGGNFKPNKVFMPYQIMTIKKKVSVWCFLKGLRGNPLCRGENKTSD